MGNRTPSRASAKAKRRSRLHQQRATKIPAGESVFGLETATLNFAKRPPAQPTSPADTAEQWIASSEELTPIKQVAAAALILGHNVSRTATALGVDRRTIQRWRKLDPEFQLAMVETKQEVIVTSRQSMLSLAEAAVDVVETKLEGEANARIALAFLRGIGVLSPDAIAGQPYESPPVTAEATDPTSSQNQVADEKCAQSATLSAANEDPTALAEQEEIYDLCDLPEQQQVAIQAFYVGKPLAEVAQLAKTCESTIRGWLCQDRAFFSVLSDLQFDRIQYLKFRIFGLIDRALKIINGAIEARDGRVALALLRGLGLMR